MSPAATPPRPSAPAGTLAVEGLRWALVLPAAVLCGLAAQPAAATVCRAVLQAAGLAAEAGRVSHTLGLFAWDAAFVAAGAALAPRRKAGTAAALAVAAGLAAIVVHVALPPRPGFANALHAAAELAGAGLAAVCVHVRERAARS